MAKRGRPIKDDKLVTITIRLDSDILAYYRATGKGWMTRMRQDLRAIAFPTESEIVKPENDKNLNDLSIKTDCSTTESEVAKIIGWYKFYKQNPLERLQNLDNICQNLLKAANTDSPDEFDLSKEDNVWKKVFDFVFSYDISRQAQLLAEELGEFLHDSSPSDGEDSYKNDATKFINDLHIVTRKISS